MDQTSSPPAPPPPNVLLSPGLICVGLRIDNELPINYLRFVDFLVALGAPGGVKMVTLVR